MLSVLLLLSLTIDTTRARLKATISEESATPAFIGQISGLAIDAKGRIYVSDFQEPRILVFSSDGQQLAVIGRKGEGPGEFTAPTGPVIGSDDALYLRNLHRVLRVQPASAGSIPTGFDRSFDGPIMAPWRSMRSSTIDQQGRTQGAAGFGEGPAGGCARHERRSEAAATASGVSGLSGPGGSGR